MNDETLNRIEAWAMYEARSDIMLKRHIANKMRADVMELLEAYRELKSRMEGLEK
jgi:hypothetical protein